MFDPAQADGLELPVTAVYSRAEMYLIRVLRDALIRLGDTPDWAEAQLLAIRQERGNIEGMAQVLQERAPELMRESIDAAYVRGKVAAEAELEEVAQAGYGFATAPGTTAVNTGAVVALTAEAAGAMSVVHQNILRNSEDIWRRIVAEASGFTVTGAMTPQQAMSRAYTRMAREGLGFFTDRRGRKWGLDTYAEMAVRTATNRALRAGHTDSMVEHGVDLVVISSHPNPAPMCAPYERKVLSLTGMYSAGRHRVEDNIVNVTATMAEAESNGLHHPNCRHTHSAYIPGFTDLTPPPADPDNRGYKATQEQRRLEREIRASKRMEQAAITDDDKRQATSRVRAYQAKLRDHISKHDLPRRRHREQLRRPANTRVAADY